MSRLDMPRVITAVLIGFFVVLVLYLSAPSVIITPRGIALPMQKANIAASTILVPADQIGLYTKETVPNSYQSLAHINIQYHAKQESPEKITLLINKARKLAAQVGANAIVVNVLGHVSDKTPNAQSSYVFRSTAIHTDAKVNSLG